jgi:hypothetical protein
MLMPVMSTWKDSFIPETGRNFTSPGAEHPARVAGACLHVLSGVLPGRSGVPDFVPKKS